MSLEHNLRQALREEAKGWSAPPELKGRILSGITPSQGGRRMKKWLVATIVAAALLIPTGAYAGYTYLADSVYGSQEHLVQMGGTQEGYDHLEAKLQQAKNSLSEEDYAALTALLHQLGAYNLKIADAEGVLHPEKLSSTDQESYKELTLKLEPYFQKLEQTESSVKRDPVNTVDSSTFWDQQLVKGEQIFSGKELASFKQLISELKAFNNQITGQDGSTHPERLTEKESARLKQLYEELTPYLKQLGIKIKPVS
ncbi:DUF3600 domain-containing protein [Paenibacillus ihuae]|uniref:DUF3600 domain-containing protein n=1 Tax=Paenibacillus ihuae TaxID=1232431 RepID=UPI0006D5346B|nr:DUF3600 domain-containing protein [Paenibacillus ihuae]